MSSIATVPVRSYNYGAGMFITFLAIQFMDSLTTVAAFQLGGYEANPIMAAILSVFGNGPGLFLVKIPFAVALYFVAGKIRPRAKRDSTIAFGLVVMWNLFVLLVTYAAKA